MFGRSKKPRDRTPYPLSPFSRVLTVTEAAGPFVFVVDEQEVIHVANDGPHMHPLVLGGGQAAKYAGDLMISKTGTIAELNNLSGTFSFRSKRSLCCVAERLQQMGFLVNAVIWYPPDGMSFPRRLSC
jgi:hypothetical protein